MENIKNWIEGNKKIPKCVAVYDKLFKMISDGEFQNEEKLPSEPALAELMGVSRMTLRQAIGLLEEDGIIRKIHGKGNYFVKNSKMTRKGLDTLQHPVYSSINQIIDDLEMEFRIERASGYSNRVLEREGNAIVSVDRWYKSEGKVVAYTLTMIPIDVVPENKINLGDREDFIDFLEERVYHKPNRSIIKFHFSETPKFISSKYPSTTDKRSFLLEEIIYNNKNMTLIHNKHYISLSNCNITLERK